MKIGARDDFENKYMGKFRALAAPYGVFVDYERDNAGRDIGLHLTTSNQTRDGMIVTPALVWFQMKGVMAGTLSSEEYAATDKVALDLEVAHLRFWYLNIQPTYLAVFVESVDRFLAIDLQKWVEDHFGNEIMTLNQKTVRVKVDKKNELDGDFFRIVLNRNLVPALRRSLSEENDKEIARFLRDSSVVQWLSNCRQHGAEARLTIVSWISKMRTEAYFEARAPEGDWEPFRAHWEYSMGELALAFPYLKFIPETRAEPVRYPDVIQDFDGEIIEIWHESFCVIESKTGHELDEDEIEGECLLEIGNSEYSYGDMGGGELVEHRLTIELNEIGERWADTLAVLVDAEVVSVDVEPHQISVAPWHARDV
ncbi:DUF4365 domain-containing protein [Ruegeria halocynthiae]|uniref:DUF4365 domain-containing protein n=1 Tax=Ruegeria halocynthiae TaxID=985054 RepID=UPI0009DD5FA9|nr:DUF4365 domain-containing protein [Ruegeria halocynthiae]